MNVLTEHLNTLILQSESILSELNKDNLEIEFIESEMDAREQTVSELAAVKTNFDESKLSDHDRDLIRTLFDKFEDLNTKINRSLQEALRESRENLTTASKKRKADDKYHVLAKPDITHF